MTVRLVLSIFKRYLTQVTEDTVSYLKISLVLLIIQSGVFHDEFI